MVPIACEVFSKNKCKIFGINVSFFSHFSLYVLFPFPSDVGPPVSQNSHRKPGRLFLFFLPTDEAPRSAFWEQHVCNRRIFLLSFLPSTSQTRHNVSYIRDGSSR